VLGNDEQKIILRSVGPNGANSFWNLMHFKVKGLFKIHQQHLITLYSSVAW